MFHTPAHKQLDPSKHGAQRIDPHGTSARAIACIKAGGKTGMLREADNVKAAELRRALYADNTDAHSANGTLPPGYPTAAQRAAMLREAATDVRPVIILADYIAQVRKAEASALFHAASDALVARG